MPLHWLRVLSILVQRVGDRYGRALAANLGGWWC